GPAPGGAPERGRPPGPAAPRTPPSPPGSPSPGATGRSPPAAPAPSCCREAKREPEPPSPLPPPPPPARPPGLPGSGSSLPFPLLNIEWFVFTLRVDCVARDRYIKPRATRREAGRCPLFAPSTVCRSMACTLGRRPALGRTLRGSLRKCSEHAETSDAEMGRNPLSPR